jgi:hypothetical protein
MVPPTCESRVRVLASLRVREAYRRPESTAAEHKFTRDIKNWCAPRLSLHLPTTALYFHQAAVNLFSVPETCLLTLSL